MKSTSGRSIESRSGAVPREAPSGPSTSERLRLGPERPPAPGGPRRSPRRGGAPGTVPVRGGRHFNRRSKGGTGGCRLCRPWLSSVFPEPRCHSNFQLLSVFWEVEGGLSWVGTRSPRTLEGKSPPTAAFPTSERVHSFLPGKARRDTLSPVPPAFIGPWKPCPVKPRVRRASSPRAFHPLWLSTHQLVHHPNDADPFMMLLSCQPLGSAISASGLGRVAQRPGPCP